MPYKKNLAKPLVSVKKDCEDLLWQSARTCLVLRTKDKNPPLSPSLHVRSGLLITFLLDIPTATSDKIQTCGSTKPVKWWRCLRAAFRCLSSFSYRFSSLCRRWDRRLLHMSLRCTECNSTTSKDPRTVSKIYYSLLLCTKVIAKQAD